MADGKSMGILPGSTSPPLIMYLTEKILGPSLEPRPLGRAGVADNSFKKRVCGNRTSTERKHCFLSLV